MTSSGAKRRHNHRIRPYLKVKSSGIIDDSFNNLSAFFHPTHKSEKLFISAIRTIALFQSHLPGTTRDIRVGSDD